MVEKNLKIQIFILLSGLIPEALMDSTLTPLYPFMVRHLMPNEKEIGYYAGILGSAFHFPSLVLNVVWGAASDRFGRKPILIVGIIVCGIATLGLGLSKSFSMTIACRFLAGMFGSNSIVAKGMIGHMARDQPSRAWAYALYGSVYALAGFIGPMFGALLAHPAENYPLLFPQNGIFGQYPYLLVCMISAMLSVCALILCVIFLKESHYSEEEVSIKETLEIHDTKAHKEDLLVKELAGEIVIDIAQQSKDLDLNMDGRGEQDLATMKVTPGKSGAKIQHGDPKAEIDGETLAPCVQAGIEQASGAKLKVFSLKTLTPMLLYGCIAYTNMSYMTALPLYFSASHERGGLSLNSRATAMSFTTLAAVKLLVQLFVFEPFVHRVGSAKITYRTGMMAYVPTHAVIPFLILMAPLLQQIMIKVVMACLGFIEGIGYLGVILMITESQLPENLGAAHGLAGLFSGVARTFAPAVAGSVWELGISVHAPWLIFILGIVISSVAVVATFYRK